MAFHTEKDFKSKNAREKHKGYILAKLIQKENLKSLPKKFRSEKGLFFGAPKFRKLKSNCLEFLLTKLLSHKKIFTL